MKLTEEKREQILQKMCKDNLKLLKILVNSILKKFGGIYQKDYDDFYSIGNEVLFFALISFDETNSNNFQKYYYHCLLNKVKSEITKRNRIKRQAEKMLFYYDTSLSEENENTLIELIPADYDLENDVIERINKYDESFIKYINSLSGLQKQILYLKIDGKNNSEIMNMLKLSENVFVNELKAMKSHDKIKNLFNAVKNNSNLEDSFMNSCTCEITDIGTFESRKTENSRTHEVFISTRYNIITCISELNDSDIRDDHPLQRNSDQWRNKDKYNLITTVLNGFPIPEIVLAEQVKNGMADVFLLDGKQRLTTLNLFYYDGFKIGTTAERSVISYYESKKDKYGEILKDEYGRVIYEYKIFDTKGKRFSDLPEELKKRFRKYEIPIVKFLQCTDEDVEYHIRRYNSSKPMTTAQKGITFIGENFANVTKKLSAHSFFKDKCCITATEFANGAIDRVIIESIMAINFLNKWKSGQESICAYLKVNAKRKHFDELEDILDRLDNVMQETSAARQIFDTKNTYIFLTVFSRFIKIAKFEDDRFIEFLENFDTLKNKIILNGKSYNEISATGTKHKINTINRIDATIKLLFEYLKYEELKELDKFETNELFNKFIISFKNIDIIKIITCDNIMETQRIAFKFLMMIVGYECDQYSDNNIQKFINEYKNLKDINNIIEDTLLYTSVLDNWSLNCDNNSLLFKSNNIPSILMLIKYVYEKEIDEKTVIKWFTYYSENYDINGNFNKYGDADRENINNKFQILFKSLKKYLRYKNKQ